MLTDRSVDVGSVRLAVRDYGGDGPPLVLIHGGPGLNLVIWDELAPMLTASYRVLTYDQRGNGASDASDDYSFDVFVDDLHALIGALQLERPVVVGQSWGGWIALVHASRWDETSVVLALDGPITYAMPPLTSRELTALDRDTHANALYNFAGTAAELENLLDRLTEEYDIDDFDKAVARRNMVCDGNGDLRSRWTPTEFLLLERSAFADAIPRLDPDDIYPRIACPVVLAGATQGTQAEPGRPFSRDKVVQVHARYPQIDVHWFETPHAIPLHAPRKVAALISSLRRPPHAE